MERIQKHIRIVVVGDGDTGKTCMLIVYKDKKYEEYYIPTVFDSYSMTITIDKKEYVMILSDTAGQEEYDRLRPLAYPETDVFIMCFSVANWDSYHNIMYKWCPEVRHYRPTAKIILVGTKCDLRQVVKDSVTPTAGEELKKKIKADYYIECSSKFMWNVDSVFEAALKIAVNNKISTKKVHKNSCILL